MKKIENFIDTCGYLGHFFSKMKKHPNIFIKDDIIFPNKCETEKELKGMFDSIIDRLDGVLDANRYKIPFIPVSEAEFQLMSVMFQTSVIFTGSLAQYRGVPIKVVNFTFNPYEK